MLKYFCLIITLLSLQQVIGQTTLKTMKRLPDTGQTNSYTNTFGEDADYNYNSPFYIDNGNSTITDTVTGLIWQKSDGGEMTYENAIIYCDTLTLGGFTDWRLPNCHELFSILSLDVTNPAINSSFFTTTNAEYWWSSQKQANDPTKIWVTNAGGGVGNHLKSETISAGGTKHFNVKAVRDNSICPTVPNHFTKNIDGTTTDNLTNLMWQQIPYNDSLTWEQALKMADTLSFGNYTDWRLPNIKELQSINDESFINPSINQSYFPGILAKKYWSSTSLPNQTTKAWYLDTRFGLTTYAYKTNRLNVLFVRNLTFTNLSINEKSLDKNELTIYPNPSKNLFSFETNSIIQSYNLINENGENVPLELKNKNVTNYSFTIQNPGKYILTLIIDNKTIVKKLIIE